MPFSMMGSNRRHLLKPRHSRQQYAMALRRAAQAAEDLKNEAAVEIARRNHVISQMKQEIQMPKWKKAVRGVKQLFQRRKTG